MNHDLSFYITGIEQGMIAALKKAVGKGDPDEGFAEDGYVRMIKGYDGELNATALRSAISKMTTSFPLIFVTYINGKDARASWDSGLPDEPMTMRRDCRFAAVVCSNDARGTEARRVGAPGSVGVYQMEADAVTALGGLRVERQDGSEKVLLTLAPLTPSGDSPIMQVPGVTAFAAYFDTYFEYDLPDRRAVEPIVIEEIIFGLDPLNTPGRPGELPGVQGNQLR
jgi:hypothetical protein